MHTQNVIRCVATPLFVSSRERSQHYSVPVLFRSKADET